MKSRAASVNLQWGRPAARAEDGGRWAARLLHVVDAGLIATICGAPFFFGGRHDLGRLVFVALVAATAIAWFVRQSRLPKAQWTRTAAHGVLLLAIGVVLLQIVPLPASWVAWLSPRTVELLPLWTASGNGATLGEWRTLSFTPFETSLGLATLLGYGLLFIVVTQRMADVSDVRRILSWVAVAAVLMAVFGLAQFFLSNGRFFWFYEHPFRSTDSFATGSFMNRNHFADFLVLGLGPLVAWLVSSVRASAANAKKHRPGEMRAHLPVVALLIAILTIVLAVALSQSRGGALALVAAMATLATIYWRWRLVDVRYLYGLAGVGLALLGLLSVYGYDKVASRLDDLAGGTLEEVDRDAVRRDIWAANIAAIQHGGLLGAGVGSHVEIAPVYLATASDQLATHAENGYLQIATESGVLGVVLLMAGIGLCVGWCVRCLRGSRTATEQLCFGATAAGLAASLVHSVVDFVWYIPATMSVTLVLAACTLRLAQFTLPEERRATIRPVLRRARWVEMTAVTSLVGAWITYVYFAPAMAAVSWDRYVRAEVANSRLTRDAWAANDNGTGAADLSLRDVLADAMLRHLEDTVQWNPRSAVAHLELAQRYLDMFEIKQQEADNAMGVVQIADTVAASRFKSPEALRAWLDRAFGANASMLYRAHDHAQRAVALCPLQGESYVLLANVGFLDSGPHSSVADLAEQGLRVRPHQQAVLFEVGRQQMLVGDLAGAIKYWSQCANSPGPHQLRIVGMLAGQYMPAAEYIRYLQPDWQTLREVWARYSQSGRSQDLADLIVYAQQVTERQVLEKGGLPPAYLWLFQASMYTDLSRPQEALDCLEKAYRAGPHLFAVRYAIGKSLLAAGRYAEAEAHVRWCLARRPEDKGLDAALREIAKARYAQRAPDEPR